MKSDATLPSVEVLTSTGVVLADGASVTIRVRVLFNQTAQPESVIQDTVLSYFLSNGAGMPLTLSNLKNDLNYFQGLTGALKGLADAKNASVIGMAVTSPPVESFEEKSKVVTAILATGETVRLKFGSPSGMPPPPSVFEMKKVYELLSSLKFSDLSSISKLLNQKLHDPNRGWDFLILGLEQLSCPCGHA